MCTYHSMEHTSETGKQILRARWYNNGLCGYKIDLIKDYSNKKIELIKPRMFIRNRDYMLTDGIH